MTNLRAQNAKNYNSIAMQNTIVWVKNTPLSSANEHALGFLFVNSSIHLRGVVA